MRGVVAEFAERLEPGPLRRVIDWLRTILGKMASLVDVSLLHSDAGITVTNAATGAGTSLTSSRVLLDMADAGADQARVVVRGKNSGAGSVQIVAYDVTNSVELARVAVTGTTETTYAGAWTSFKPTGIDQEVELRVIGDGAFDPVLFRVSLQLRTLKVSP